MNTSDARKTNMPPFRQGVILGLAGPLLFLGAMPRYDTRPGDNVAQAWRNVGDSLRNSMRREEVRLRDRKT